MSTRNNKLALAIAAALGLALPASAFATNGYFAHGYGTKNKGMAGAGVALPQDAMQAATNPAGMVWVGERLDIGYEMFSPASRGYTFMGVLEEKSDSTFFIIPHLAYNWMLTSDSSLGVTMYGNGGMNTDYRDVFGALTGTPGTRAGVDLSQLFLNVSYAHKIMSNASVGGSVIWAYQRFKGDGLLPFTDPGYDTSQGWGIKLGGQMDVGGGVTLGASYQSKMSMDEFDKYALLFAEQGGFDIPSSWTLGVAYQAMPDLVVLFDYQAINYTDVKSVSNSMVSPGAPGSENAPGFGWEDINVFKLGVQYTLGSWQLRGGWNKGDNPIPSQEVGINVFAPGVVEDHYTFGFTKTLGANTEINFMYMHAPEVSVVGTGPSAGAEIFMTQNAVELSIGTKF
jgi:long-chain fatty acid transport protein